ncbi:MAG: putative peptidoglycan glycosyltransferase FtsW [Pseudomonadota bacterium]
MIAVSRADTGYLARWWWTVDRPVAFASLALMGLGLILVATAGPAAAARISSVADASHFIVRHAVFLAPAAVVLTATALAPASWVRRAALAAFLGSLALIVLALMVGPEIKGAHRWIDLGPFMLQPSEFLKPGLVVACAWVLSERLRDPEAPGRVLAIAAYLVSAGLLIKQPDYGQFLLTTAAWGATFFVAGLNWAWIAALSTFAVSALAGAYLAVPHVAHRIDAFMNPETADTFQVDRSIETIMRGGLFGAGPGEGVAKQGLPDAHTDFIFAVLAEEYGLVACAGLVVLYAFIALRAFSAAARRGSVFQQSAVAGLATLIGAQAFINIGVALRVLPAKGMTLPFLSYGGSSLIATAFTLGLILALGRDHGPARRRAEELV